MAAVLRYYQVIAAVPIVVEDDGYAVSYNPGAVFRALDSNLSVIRLLELGSIVLVAAPPQPGSIVLVPGPVGPSGPAGPTGPTGPPGTTYWKDPVSVHGYTGNRTVAQLNALTPANCDAYVTLNAGTLTAGSLAVVAGDLVEYHALTLSWVKIWSGVGGVPPTDARALVATGASPLVAPLVDGVDEGKIATFNGFNMTPTFDSPTEGWAVLIIGNGACDENNGYTFSGSVPSGTWLQFTAGVGIVYAPVGDISSVVPGDAAGAGVLNNVPRGDHQHAVPVATPVAVAKTNSSGVASSTVRSDHAHASPAETSADKDLLPSATVGNSATTGLAITFTPALDSYVRVSVNGLEYVVGDGVTTGACYFSNTGGVTARTIANITAGDILYWNGLNVGFDLEADDSVDFDYLAF